MRLVIAGSRWITDFGILLEAVEEARILPRVTRIASGGAPGVDTLAEQLAGQRNLPFIPFPADWKRFGKGAGPLRNAQMAQWAIEGRPAVDGALLTLWDGVSRGTNDMIRQARFFGIEQIFIHRVKPRKR